MPSQTTSLLSTRNSKCHLFQVISLDLIHEVLPKVPFTNHLRQMQIHQNLASLSKTEFQCCYSAIIVWWKNVVAPHQHTGKSQYFLFTVKGPLFRVYSLIKVKCVLLCVGCPDVLTIQSIERHETLCPTRLGKGISRKKVLRSSHWSLPELNMPGRKGWKA